MPVLQSSSMWHLFIILCKPVIFTPFSNFFQMRHESIEQIRAEGTYTEVVEFKPFRSATSRVVRYRKHMRGLKGLPMSPTLSDRAYIGGLNLRDDEAPETKSPPRNLNVEAAPQRRHSTKHLATTRTTRTASPAAKPPVPVQKHSTSSARARCTAVQMPGSVGTTPCSAAAPKRRTGLMSAMRIFSR